MDKLKKMLSPGHDKDEKVMYGEGNTTSGTTAAHDPSHANQTNAEGLPVASTGTGKHYDEPLHPTPAAQKDYGASIPAATGNAMRLSDPADDAASTASIRSGVVGAAQPPVSTDFSRADYPTGTTGTGGHDLTDRTMAGSAAATSGYNANEAEASRHGLSPIADTVSSHEHKGHGHVYDGDPCPPGDEPRISGAPSHIPGPHATDMANRLDPHIPGEYPDSTGRDAHASQRGNHPSTDAMGAAGLGTSQDARGSDEPSTAGIGSYDDQRFDPSATHGAGAAGVGAYEATRPVGPTSQDPASFTTGPHSSNMANIVDPRVQPQPDKMTSNRAGPTEQDPASFTTGPHSSNIANIVDPRVRPEPEKMKDRTTTGPHASDTLNRMDPKVEANPPQTESGHDYGRDAAIAGGAGAGAAGVGAYEATHGDHLSAPSSAPQPLATPTGAPRDARIFDQTQQVSDSEQTSAGWATDSKTQHKLEHERAKEADKTHHSKHSGDSGDKKSGGILGFLHGNKKSKGTDEEEVLKEQGNLREADQIAHARHQRELESGAAAGTVGVAGASFEPSLREQQQHPDASAPQKFTSNDHGHNKLHKDPPAKVQRELEQKAQYQGSSGV